MNVVSDTVGSELVFGVACVVAVDVVGIDVIDDEAVGPVATVVGVRFVVDVGHLVGQVVTSIEPSLVPTVEKPLLGRDRVADHFATQL